MNASVQKAYQDGIETGIQTDQAIARLNEIGDKGTKFEALELCFEVMSANDKISPDEINLIRAYADLLNIPKEEFERLKDFHTLNVTLAENPENDDERLIGIDPAWPKEEKLVYLRKEFKKWNSRMASLTDPDQRKIAQHRLDMIGRIRQKFEPDEIESLIGINPAWPREQKLIYLREELKICNSRMDTLTDPEQLRLAKHRLDMIVCILQRYETEETS